MLKGGYTLIDDHHAKFSSNRVKKKNTWNSFTNYQEVEVLTFWPIGKDSFFQHGHSWGWWVPERTNIWSIIQSKLQLHQFLLRHFTSFLLLPIQRPSTRTVPTNLSSPGKKKFQKKEHWIHSKNIPNQFTDFDDNAN